jgi:glucokinase
MNVLLAGDVGATKTNLGIYSAEKGPQQALAEGTFFSSRYSSLVTLVSEFLVQVKLNAEYAVFGVAGPVISGKAVGTNLSWIVDEAHLKKQLKLKAAFLLNDVEATAYGVPLLDSTDLHCLNKGEQIQGGTIAVIAPGTGLGEAFLTWDGARYRAHASEGGHTDFAPATPLEDGLLQYLRDQGGQVSYESVCSGIGLPSLYRYLRDSGRAEEPLWLAEQLAQTDDPTPLIITTALEDKAGVCAETLKLFISILGTAAGNLALTVMATGGVFLGGGIPPRIITVLNDGPFMNAFCNKGRLSHMMARIPVSVILNPKAALIGVAAKGLELFSE